MTTNSSRYDPTLRNANEQGWWVSDPRAAARAVRARARALRAREEVLIRRWLRALAALERVASARAERREKARQAVTAAMWPYTPNTYSRVINRPLLDWRRRSRVDPYKFAKITARVEAATKRHEQALRRLDADLTAAQDEVAAATTALLASIPHLGQVVGLSGRAVAELTRTRTGA